MHLLLFGVMLVIRLSGGFQILNTDVNDKKKTFVQLYVHKYFPERSNVKMDFL